VKTVTGQANFLSVRSPLAGSGAVSPGGFYSAKSAPATPAMYDALMRLYIAGVAIKLSQAQHLKNNIHTHAKPG